MSKSNGIDDKLAEEDAEAWEEELDEALGDAAKLDLTDWQAICQDAEGKLQKERNILPVSRINQYQIIVHFCTLCLKGVT